LIDYIILSIEIIIIVIAIILSLLDVPDELIIKDYLSSQKFLQPIQSDIIKDMRKIGLPEEFSVVNYEVNHLSFIYLICYYLLLVILLVILFCCLDDEISFRLY